MTVLSPFEAYRILATTYDEAPNPVLALERRTLKELLPSLAGARVIDAATGTGYWASYCAERGADVIAVDFCEEMLAQLSPPLRDGAIAGRIAPWRKPGDSCLADINQLPFPDAIADVMICAFALGYAPRCLPELARVTRPGGIVIASDVHPDALRRGWTRSFRHGGETIEVAHEPYDLETPGLKLDAFVEASFGEAERTIFEAAGKSFEEAAREPAIFVARWVKTHLVKK